MNRWFPNSKSRFIPLTALLVALIIAALSGGSRALSAQGGPWEGRYWNNRSLTGSPVLVRQDAAVNFDWGAGSPGSQVFSDNFSAQWTQTAALAAGTYRFTATADDGMRVWVDNVKIIDSWIDGPARTIVADVFLGAGNHTVVVQYYEAGGVATAKMSYALVSAPAPQPSPNQPWFNEYFANTNLSGSPALTGTTSEVNFNWGFNSPAAGFPADRFSVRWVRTLSLEGGRYRFTTITDDGVRLWVNNALVIDQWRVMPATTFVVDLDLPGGNIPIKMEYFEDTGRAEARLNWTRVSGGQQPGTGGQFPGTGTVTSYRLNLRRGPGTNFAVITKLMTGEVVNLTGLRNGDATWVQVSTANGTVGWASAIYLRTSIPVSRLTPVTPTTPTTPPTNPPPATGQGTATVVTGALNVRTGPGVGFPSFTTLNNGATVTLLARDPSSTWVKIIMRDGRQGWVNAGFLSMSVPIGNLPVLNI